MWFQQKGKAMKIRWMMMAGLVGLCGMAQAGFVMIGNPGNAADTADGDPITTGVQRYGAVAYTYKISQYEVTIAQMRASGAGNGNETFWSALGTNAPASRVTLYEAMKYCNWLTSGDANNGAYKFSGGVYESTDRASAVITYGKVYALPTEDEWYKAAYFKPDGSGYSRYANGTSTVPAKASDVSTGWNYDKALDPSKAWTVDKGTVEQNGTFNMMGNVWEWMETPIGVRRGGAYVHGLSYLSMTGRTSWAPTTENEGVGFRVVEISPEPVIEKNK
jgi:sulfatase modifying factor 1